MILPKQYSGNTVQILFLKSMKKLIIFFQFKAYLKMNWAVCKTPWSHRIFYTSYCQISQASGFVLRKGKNSPPEPSLPVARLKLGTFAALAVSPARWGAGCQGQLSQGWFPAAALPLLLLLLLAVPSLQLGVPTSPTAPGVQQHTPFTVTFSQLSFQMFPAADGSFRHCSPHPAVPLGTLQCLTTAGRAPGTLGPSPLCSPPAVLG